MKIKNNIWLAFYLLLFIGFTLLTSISYLQYKDVKKDYYLENEYLTQIVAQATGSIFVQYEMMLEVLGEQLIEHNNYKKHDRTTFLLDRLMEKNPTLAGLGLIDINGNFLTVSSNISMQKLQNLTENEKTRDSFAQTLNSNHLILGRSYFVEGIGEWVLPLRMAISDEMKRPIAVMTAGLRIGAKNGLFNRLKLSENTSLLLVREQLKDKKSYIVYDSDLQKSKNYELYNKAVPKEVSEDVAKRINEKYGKTLEEIKQEGTVVSMKMMNFSGVEKFAGLIYDKKYELWVVVESPVSKWVEEFIRMMIVYVMIFILAFYVMFKLFSFIEKSEKTRIEELMFQATHDTLTQLPNRNYLDKFIDIWIKKFSHSFEILFIDLDNFKNVNDHYGHHVGDEILKEVALRYKHFFSEEHLIVRHGGDEFIILMAHTKLKEKELLMLSLIDLISRPYVVEGLEFNIGSSIGTARYPQDANTFEELMSLADIAMYEAKKVKNSYCVFSSIMKDSSVLKGEMEQELRTALDKNEFSMVYQPQINSDGSLHGVEALVRWRNERLGFVSPDKFITVAEETGIIKNLGNFILLQSLTEIKELKEILGYSFQLSINVSVKQLMSVDFLAQLLWQLNALNFERSALTLEITESLCIEDMEYVLPLLHKIKKEGINLSLDDFGTGYSSLSILRDLPVGELKIDKSFIDEILNKKEDAALVENIISIGKNLNMSTLAEGTETLAQVEKLKEFGCDIFQGYYFSRPLPKQELLKYLRT